METKSQGIKINLSSIDKEMPTEYNDGDIMIMDGIKKMPDGTPLQLDMVMLLLCEAGKAQVDINETTYAVARDDILVFPPDARIENYLISPDFECKIIGLSYPALQRMLQSVDSLWDLDVRLSSCPLFHSDETDQEIIAHYYSLLQMKLEERDHSCRREVLHALFQAIFFDLYDVVRRNTDVPGMGPKFKQGEQLTKRFLKLLVEARGRQRSVNYFAERLCVTPKYLSTVCRQTTGRAAKAWIQDYTLEILKQQLKPSGRSIKEISDSLGFPSLAVFGKFVKSALGLSPSAYRSQLTQN